MPEGLPTAAERRQRVAHSVSCGLFLARVKSSGGATDTLLPLLRSSVEDTPQGIALETTR
jgi:hypothetical protein